MKTKYYIYCLLLTILIACGEQSNNNSQNQNTQKNNVETPKSYFTLEVNNQNSNNKDVCGSEYLLKIKSDTTINIDSIKILIDGKKHNILIGETEYLLKTENLHVGNVRISAEVNYNNKTEYLSSTLKLKSNIVPSRVKYKVVKTYPHDKEAYTQGLVFDNGVMYESTGLKGKSSLRKVQFEKGEIIQSITLKDEYFGEGLAMDNNRLIQLTWQNHKGFVYNKTDFSKIQEFDIATEGWGLVMYNDTLILSDGSENLYFLDKNTFSNNKIIQVYDDNGPVKMLNELEIIENQLFANIYQTDLIAVIDIQSGKVLKYIDFTGLLSPQYQEEYTDVLNGIAYDPKNKKIYVTGKNWPLLFEIKIE
ncbi:MAG: glutaminyl-peptide cyclotransferase [Bacteroidales bacterium]|nr:glutaminyl-peptide cyclotransferase [Bacteroidales bacterium]